MQAFRTFTISLLLAIVLCGCTPLINLLAFHPDKTNVVAADKLPPDIQELTITTEDNVPLTLLYLPAEKSDRLLIYFHGNAGNIYHRIPSLRLLNSFGIHVIGVSYRGYGKSGGTPSEAGIYRDGEAVFRYATNNMGFAEANITLFGRSIGSTVALNTAQNRNIHGLILIAPLTTGMDQAQSGGVASALMSPLAGSSFDNLSKIKHLTAPLLVIHGSEDRTIPYSMGKKIYDHANVEKKIVRIEGGDHNNLQSISPNEYWRPIMEFVDGE